MLFLVDESTGKKFAALLAKELNAIYAGDYLRSATDESVLEFAKKEKRIIITDDKDFGELVFRLGKPSSGILLLRLQGKSVYEKSDIVFKLVKQIDIKEKFIVISNTGIRIRKMK